MPRENMKNPFNITKGDDFSDREINDYWVDFPPTGGFVNLAKPTSPMPMLILGGKGSGKTHLMRYFSYPLQKIRNKQNLPDGIRADGYIGIYLRCGGLNAARFQGKAQGEDAWATVFAYYMELWLSQLVLDIVVDAFRTSDEFRASEGSIVHEISSLFDVPFAPVPVSVSDLREGMAIMQRHVDSAVNNSAISRKLEIQVRATRGKLIFGIPRLLAEHLPSLSQCLFVYLIDEFENLSEAQQKYVNTLIRERQSPSSFKIGSRLYGVHTYATYSADEENKEGSEFEVLRLDARLRNSEKYSLFAMRLVAKRLQESGYRFGSDSDEKHLAGTLKALFERFPTGRLGREETQFIVEKYAERERPYFGFLRQKLERGMNAGMAPGVKVEGTISEIVSLLAVPDLPLLEKANILFFYKAWASNKHLPDAAQRIHDDCKRYISETAGATAGENYSDLLLHFKSDLIAQLFRDCGGNDKQLYTGIETFIDMSWGLPRNLLIVLKHVFAWAVFNGERPFEEEPISLKAQESGLEEAVEWFYHDAKMIGRDGAEVQGCITRLSTLFRSIRFSDKPAECSCCAFSADVNRASEGAQRFVDLAVKWSLLIDVGTQRDRNTTRVDFKFQLNRMLAPRWDLAIYRRGVVALRPEEVTAIFDPEHKGDFEGVSRRRIDRMTAPFFAKKGQAREPAGSFENDLLPGLGDD